MLTPDSVLVKVGTTAGRTTALGAAVKGLTEEAVLKESIVAARRARGAGAGRSCGAECRPVERSFI
jgi:hypothetical protein